jgi:hypothetical protein
VKGRRAAALAPKAGLAILGAILFAGCLHGAGEEPRARPEAARSGPVAVDAGAERGVAYVAGDRLYGLRASRPIRLAAAINTTLIANLSPAAVPAPAGRLLAYNSWRGGGPVVRIRDLETGKDDVLDEGAVSLAWRRDGALAYFKALKRDVGAPRRYAGRVVVRRAPAADPVRWTPTPRRYLVAAWAGRRLLAYRMRSRWPDLIALDAPGRARLLARAGALVAVSPDGSRAFVSTYGASPPLVRVLDIASGREIARRAFRELRWLTESGAWTGDLVVATGNDGLAVFRVRRRAIALEQVLRFAPAGFPVGPFEPRLEDAGRRITGWAELESQPREALPQAAVLTCDRVARRCRHAPPVSTGVGLRLVYNPSRP